MRAYADARNQTTTYDYDPLNHLKETKWPDQTHRTVDYDASDNPCKITDPNLAG